MSSLTLFIKPTAGGDKLSVELARESSVEQLKQAIQERHGVPAQEQRLIYKGQVLKDEKPIGDYGLQNEHVLHMVRKPSQPAGGPSPSAPGAAAGLGAGSDASQGLGGMPGVGGGSPQQMQDMLSNMMNNPAMQQIMNNPDSMRSMLQSMPAVSQLMDRNPEFAQLINNPQLLQDAMAASANPSLMREQMRTADRAMSNIESHPEGFNMLRRMYENVQAPLMNARDDAASAQAPAAPSATPPSQDGSTPPSTSAPAASAAPNAAPLPNPWAAAGGGAAAGRPAATPGGLPAGLGGMGGLGALGAMGGMGGMGQGGQPDINSMMQAMQNPAMQQMVQNVMSQPGMMETIANNNPQLRAMMDANPQVRETLSNPAALQQALNPDNMRAMLQMQQAMQQLSGSGLMPAMPGMPGGGAGGQPGAQGGMPDMGSLMAMMGGAGMGGMGGLGIPPVANPEEAFAQQLTQLQGMGFIDRQANIRALQSTGGDVNGAVERLLSGA